MDCSESEWSLLGYPLHSPLSPSLLLPCVAVCHQIPFPLYLSTKLRSNRNRRTAIGWSVLISGFRRFIIQVFAPLGHKVAQAASLLLTFWASLSFSMWKIWFSLVNPWRCPETSVISYRPKLQNIPERRRNLKRWNFRVQWYLNPGE